MKIGKILAVATLAVAAGQSVVANAATGSVCAGGAVAGTIALYGGSGAPVTGTDVLFIKTGFNAQCSANVVMSYNEVSSTTFGVAAASRKGNQSFGGNSASGTIEVLDKFTPGASAEADVTTVNNLLTNSKVQGSGSN